MLHSSWQVQVVPSSPHHPLRSRMRIQLCVCVFLKLLGPIAPALSAFVTPRGYTVYIHSVCTWGSMRIPRGRGHTLGPLVALPSQPRIPPRNGPQCSRCRRSRRRYSSSSESLRSASERQVLPIVLGTVWHRQTCCAQMCSSVRVQTSTTSSDRNLTGQTTLGNVLYSL